MAAAHYSQSSTKIVDHVKGLKPFAGIKHIAHEIGRPGFIGRRHPNDLCVSVNRTFFI